jgi:hypothetical protein
MVLLAVLLKDFGVGVSNLGSEVDHEATHGSVDLLELAPEVGGGVGDGDDAEGGTVADKGFVEFGYTGVEGVAEFFLEGSGDLATVLEGLGVGDFEFDG